MSYFFKKNINKELLLISIVYFAAHWFLFIATGKWWDDWCMVDQPFSVLKNFAMEMGRPSVIFIMSVAKMLPESGYRIITFFMFYFCCLFLFKIMKNGLSLPNETCLWICMLYAVIPTNDVRIILAVFPYSISLFCFMAAMYWLSTKLSVEELNWKDRIICYLLFVVSFTTQSIIVFYVLAFLMIVIIKLKQKALYMGPTKVLKKYTDFLMLPIIFYIIKIIFFGSSLFSMGII